MRILVVEDERLLCDGIAEDLRLEKYTVDCCYDGPAACERLFVEPYDLVVLDLNLPGMDGLELLRHIRTEQPELRVLILSARSQLSDKVAGLDLGADDYLTKPFALEELEARVRTLLRREFRQRESLVQVGALTLNTVTREVSGRGEPLPLTPREFAILEHLMLHRGCWMQPGGADGAYLGGGCQPLQQRRADAHLLAPEKTAEAAWAMIRSRPR